MIKISYKNFQLKEFSKTEYNIYNTETKKYSFDKNVLYPLAVKKLRKHMVGNAIAKPDNPLNASNSINKKKIQK